MKAFLCNINFVLIFVGYPLVTSIFISDISSSSSQLVTLPYRAFALVISLLVLILNTKSVTKYPMTLKLFLLFWILLFIRMFYDLELRSDIFVESGNKMQVVLYAVCICFITMMSVVKSFDCINLDVVLNWMYWGLNFVLVLSILGNKLLLAATQDISGRMDANMAMNSISFGHLGVTIILLGIYFFNKKQKIFLRLLVIVSMSIGVIVLLRAGSRGPLITLVFILLFLMLAKMRSILNGLLLLCISVLLVYIFKDKILEWIGYVSPVLESRLTSTIEEGDSSGRDLIIDQAINLFQDNPIVGYCFALIDTSGKIHYSHNIILDAFMGLGIFGGFLFLYICCISLVKSFTVIKSGVSHNWVVLLFIQQLIGAMFSGAIYYEQELTVLFAYIFLLADKLKQSYKLNELNYDESMFYGTRLYRSSYRYYRR